MAEIKNIDTAEKQKKALTDSEIDRKTKSMAKRLNSEPKEKVIYQRAEYAPNGGDLRPFTVNGVRYILPIGEEFEVPASVAAQVRDVMRVEKEIAITHRKLAKEHPEI
jgi:5-formyltetrahydrofolate cyclo-ligase